MPRNVVAEPGRRLGEAEQPLSQASSPTLMVRSPRSSNNPPWWPTNHRNIPDHRAPRFHPEFWALTNNSVGEAVVVGLVFAGSQLLAVS